MGFTCTLLTHGRQIKHSVLLMNSLSAGADTVKWGRFGRWLLRDDLAVWRGVVFWLGQSPLQRRPLPLVCKLPAPLYVCWTVSIISLNGVSRRNFRARLWYLLNRLLRGKICIYDRIFCEKPLTQQRVSVIYHMKYYYIILSMYNFFLYI